MQPLQIIDWGDDKAVRVHTTLDYENLVGTTHQYYLRARYDGSGIQDGATEDYPYADNALTF